MPHERLDGRPHPGRDRHAEEEQGQHDPELPCRHGGGDDRAGRERRDGDPARFAHTCGYPPRRPLQPVAAVYGRTSPLRALGSGVVAALAHDDSDVRAVRQAASGCSALRHDAALAHLPARGVSDCQPTLMTECRDSRIGERAPDEVGHDAPRRLRRRSGGSCRRLFNWICPTTAAPPPTTTAPTPAPVTTATTTGTGTRFGIVTTDVGFCALPPASTTIFTDSTRVARCRELRARRG